MPLSIVLQAPRLNSVVKRRKEPPAVYHFGNYPLSVHGYPQNVHGRAIEELREEAYRFSGDICGWGMWRLHWFLRCAAISAAAVLTAGCETYLIPAPGPNAAVVKMGHSWTGPAYGLVKLTPDVVNILEEYGPRTLSATFGDRRPPPEITFGIGDVVAVSVFEAAAGGLFIPSEAGGGGGHFVFLRDDRRRNQG